MRFAAARLPFLAIKAVRLYYYKLSTLRMFEHRLTILDVILYRVLVFVNDPRIHYRGIALFRPKTNLLF